MSKVYQNLILFALFAALCFAGYRIAYSAGYAAHQTLSDAERAATLAANAKVAQGASHELSFDLGKVSAFDADASKTLMEIENYVPDSASDACGIPVDRLRLLQDLN